MSNSLSPEILQPAVAKANDAEDQASLAAMPITQHLTVLRQHLVKIVAVLLGFFFAYCRSPIKPIPPCPNHFVRNYQRSPP